MEAVEFPLGKILCRLPSVIRRIVTTPAYFILVIISVKFKYTLHDIRITWYRDVFVGGGWSGVVTRFGLPLS